MIPSLALRLLPELRAYLDRQTITGDTIGDIRRRCFVPWDSEWNSIVRDETAKREQPTVPSESDEDKMIADSMLTPPPALARPAWQPLIAKWRKHAAAFADEKAHEVDRFMPDRNYVGYCEGKSMAFTRCADELEELLAAALPPPPEEADAQKS